jgi:hypothetical protein
MTTNPEINRLYAAWRRLGVNFSVTSCNEMVEVEPLILATAAVAGADERLTTLRMPAATIQAIVFTKFKILTCFVLLIRKAYTIPSIVGNGANI